MACRFAIEWLARRTLISAAPYFNGAAPEQQSLVSSYSDGSTAYFATLNAAVSPYSMSVYRTDGTAAGTSALIQLPAVNAQLGTQFTRLGNYVYFEGPYFFGTDLYAINLQNDSVARVSSWNNSQHRDGVGGITSWNGMLFYVARTPVGAGLFKVDPSNNQSTLVKAMPLGSGSGTCGMSLVGTQLIALTFDGVSISSVWKSDGTSSGTMLVRTLNNTIVETRPNPVVELNGAAYFTAGSSLWRTNGTTAGTVLVRDLGSYSKLFAGPGVLLMLPTNVGIGGVGLVKYTTDGLTDVELSETARAWEFYNGPVSRPEGIYFAANDNIFRVSAAGVVAVGDRFSQNLAFVDGDIYYSGPGESSPVVGRISPTQTIGPVELIDGPNYAQNQFMYGASGFLEVESGIVYGYNRKLYLIPKQRATLPKAQVTLFNDVNRNGVRDEGEPAETSAVWVYLDLDGDGVQDPNEVSRFADGNARVSLPELQPGLLRIGSRASVNFAVPSSPASGSFAVELAQGDVVTLVMAYKRVNTISGTVFNDLNANDFPDLGEPPFAGGVIFVDLNADGELNADEPSAVSNDLGAWRFDDAPVGNLRVEVAPPQGGYKTFPVSNGVLVNTSATGSVRTGLVFGVSQTLPDSYVVGQLFSDLNGNGLRSVTEPFLGLITLGVDVNNDGVLQASEPQTNVPQSGAVSIRGKFSGDLSLISPQLRDWRITTPQITLPPGARRFDVLIGAAVAAADVGAVSGRVFDDLDADGNLDSNEFGRATRIWVDINNNLVMDLDEPMRISDSLGRFTLSGLGEASYRLRWQLPNNTWRPTTMDVGFAGQAVTTSASAVTSVALGALQVPADQRGSMTILAYHDRNVDGMRDTNEELVSTAAYLDLDHTGTFTSGDPTVSPISAAPNQYRVAVNPPTGWVAPDSGFRLVQVTAGVSIGVLLPLVRLQNAVQSAEFRVNDPLHRVQIMIAAPLMTGFVWNDVASIEQLSGLPLSFSVSSPQPTTALLQPQARLPDGIYRIRVLGAALAATALTPPLDSETEFHVLAGDATRDRAVSLDDFTILASAFGASGKVFTQGDFNYSGTVDLNDFTILAAQFGKSLEPASRAVRLPARASGHDGLGSIAIKPFSMVSVAEAGWVDDDLTGARQHEACSEGL